MDDKKERRFAEHGTIEIRQEDAKSDRVEGYAALYNSTANLGPFDEVIAPGAFDDVLNDDIRILFNHDPNFPLARSNKGQGTARVWTDDKGLKYSFKPGSQTYSRDLVEAISRGDISQSSFGFSIKSETWEHRDGRDLRTINSVEKLYDLSPVSFPAYQDTEVALRTKPDSKDLEPKKSKDSEPKNENNSVAVMRQKLNLQKLK
jgi:hypothetical protein